MTAPRLGTIESVNWRPHQRQFVRRSSIPLKRDCLWQIESGVVRTMTCLEDGNVATLGLWGTGDVISANFIQGGNYQIECLSSVDAILYPLNDYPQLNEALIKYIRQLQEYVNILHCRSLDVALLKLLAWLAKKFGRQVEQGQLINLRLTHQEIAEILGTTRVTITRLLNEFEQRGAIKRLPRQFIVLQEQQPFWYYEI
jgi:CRP-like cAMP-binding protein